MRLACVTLTLLIAASSASSGPIRWSYHAEVAYDADYGDRFQVNLSPDDTITTPPGDYSSVFLFNSTGNPRPEPGEYEAKYGFLITVTITDQASGQSREQGFAGAYSALWFYPEWERDNPDAWRWDSEWSYFGEYWDVWSFELGRNRYHVRAYGGGSGQFPNGDLVVQVEPMAAPEPGTLALAALGLGAVGLRLARRKVAPR